MNRRSRHRTGKCEEVLSAALKDRDERPKRLLRVWPTYARRHATAVAAIVLSGQPRIDEPLNRAWARALQHYGIDNNDQIAAARQLYPTIRGGKSESARFSEIFRMVPIWLLQFTAMAMDARFLRFELPDISKTLKWGSAGLDDARRWPFLPTGTIMAGDPIPDVDGRRFWIMLSCMITEPFPDVESMFRQEQKRPAPRGSEVELFEYLAQSEVKPESEWSTYEKRRVRKLCERILGSKR